MNVKHTHDKGFGNLFAFSISFSRAFGMIGIDLFEHSWLITLYAKDVAK